MLQQQEQQQRRRRRRHHQNDRRVKPLSICVHNKSVDIALPFYRTTRTQSTPCLKKRLHDIFYSSARPEPICNNLRRQNSEKNLT